MSLFPHALRQENLDSPSTSSAASDTPSNTSSAAAVADGLKKVLYQQPDSNPEGRVGATGDDLPQPSSAAAPATVDAPSVKLPAQTEEKTQAAKGCDPLLVLALRKKTLTQLFLICIPGVSAL